MSTDAKVAELRRERDEWQEAAEKFCDDYHAELDRRIDVEGKVERVRALGEGWVGFDDSHHYGDAVLTALASSPTTHESEEA